MIGAKRKKKMGFGFSDTNKLGDRRNNKRTNAGTDTATHTETRTKDRKIAKKEAKHNRRDDIHRLRTGDIAETAVY